MCCIDALLICDLDICSVKQLLEDYPRHTRYALQNDSWIVASYFYLCSVNHIFFLLQMLNCGYCKLR